jgi:hypothetical protein
MNRNDYILLGVGAVCMSVGPLLLGAPWWFAVPFGPAFMVASFAGGYFAGGGPASQFWSSLFGRPRKVKP